MTLLVVHPLILYVFLLRISLTLFFPCHIVKLSYLRLLHCIVLYYIVLFTSFPSILSFLSSFPSLFLLFSLSFPYRILLFYNSISSLFPPILPSSILTSSISLLFCFPSSYFLSISFTFFPASPSFPLIILHRPVHFSTPSPFPNLPPSLGSSFYFPLLSFFRLFSLSLSSLT